MDTPPTAPVTEDSVRAGRRGRSAALHARLVAEGGGRPLTAANAASSDAAGGAPTGGPGGAREYPMSAAQLDALSVWAQLALHRLRAARAAAEMEPAGGHASRPGRLTPEESPYANQPA